MNKIESKMECAKCDYLTLISDDDNEHVLIWICEIDTDAEEVADTCRMCVREQDRRWKVISQLLDGSTDQRDPRIAKIKDIVWGIEASQ
jgi:succinyl-CoA synthetase alpha subunit